MKYQDVISGDCKVLPLEWDDNLVPEPLLPQQHGTEVTLKCSPGFVIRGTQRTTCNDGVLELDAVQPPFCISGMWL